VAKCGFVKYCIKCKVREDTATFLPQDRLTASQVVNGIQCLGELNKAKPWFHGQYKESIQTLLTLRQENTWTKSQAQLIKDWGYIDLPRKYWDRVAQIPNHYAVVQVEVLGHEPEPHTMYAVRHDSGNGIYKWIMKEKWGHKFDPNQTSRTRTPVGMFSSVTWRWQTCRSASPRWSSRWGSPWRSWRSRSSSATR